MALAADLIGKTDTEIGRAFKRERTTVLHAREQAMKRPDYFVLRAKVKGMMVEHQERVAVGDSADVRRCERPECGKLFHRGSQDRQSFRRRRFCCQQCSYSVNGKRLVEAKRTDELSSVELSTRNLLIAMMRDGVKHGHTMWLESPAQFRALAARHGVTV